MNGKRLIGFWASGVLFGALGASAFWYPSYCTLHEWADRMWAKRNNKPVPARPWWRID